VEDARRHDEAHIAQLGQLISQPTAQADRRVDEQIAARQPDDGHPPSHLEAEIAKRLLGGPQVGCYLTQHALLRRLKRIPGAEDTQISGAEPASAASSG
jgi:hypothetical protein